MGNPFDDDGSGLLVLAFASSISALAIVGFQTGLWLMSGIWTSFSALDIWRLLIDSFGLDSPKDALGLGKVLDFVPMSVVLAVFGVLIIWIERKRP